MTTVREPTGRPVRRTRPHPAAVVVLVLVVWVVGVLLATSSLHGTGARDVGVRGEAPVADAVAAAGPAVGPAVGPAPRCEQTVSNPGGDNNYRARAAFRPDLGRGFVFTGAVRDTACRPLPGVRLQVWVQTVTGSERENRTSVLTDAAGRYRVETDAPVSQFGEPNIHVAYDEGRRGPMREVFLRNVVREGDRGAQVDLVLGPW